MNNDIVTKSRLNAALGTEGNMGFEHNDIVTVDKMNEAIAEGGGGSIATAKVTLVDQTENGGGYRVLLTFIPEGDTNPLVNVSHDSPVTVQFPLYHGAYFLEAGMIGGSIDFSTPPETTGGVAMSEGRFMITGDGSISMSSKAGASGSVAGV